MQRGNATQQIASIRVAEQAGVDAANLASVLKIRIEGPTQTQTWDAEKAEKDLRRVWTGQVALVFIARCNLLVVLALFTPISSYFVDDSFVIHRHLFS